MERFEICVNGRDVEIEVEDEEVWSVLENLGGYNRKDFEIEGFEDENEYFEDLVDGNYQELCNYFEETKADNIAANWEMEKENERYYRYGRNY